MTEDVWAEITRLSRQIEAMPPIRTEPMKLTIGQFLAVRARTARPQSPYGLQIGHFGVPVVLVANESESTPVVEGWIKPKRPESRRERRKRLGLHWWRRGGR